MEKIKQTIKNMIHLIRTKEKIPILISATEDKILDNKVALVAGGSGDIGKEIAKEMLRSGCCVIITGTRQEKIDKVVKELGSKNVAGIVLNIEDVTDLENKIQRAKNLFPQKKIDILINCVGINDSAGFLEVSENVYDKIMAVNAKGVFFLSQVIAKYMIQNHISGHILNVSSSSALRPASTPYILSKWMVAGMTKGLADVLINYRIVVNAIAPGPVATSMVGKNDIKEIGHDTSPSGRYALPHEIAHFAVQMVSGYGDLIVGETLYITGGSGIISLHR